MLPQTYLAVLVLAFLSGITTIIGVLLALWLKKSVKGIVIGLGFSAGIMLLISFFELIPESIGAAGVFKAVTATFFGILLVAILNFILPHTHLIKEKGKFKGSLMKTAYLVAFGLILHDFPEGFAMANSYIFSPGLGILVALAIAIHNIPEEFSIAIPLVMTKKKSFLLKAAFLSGLAEPAGAAVGLFSVFLLPALNPLFMAFAAGAMIFVSIHELVPMAKRYKRTNLFVLGMILSAIVYAGLSGLIPH